MSNERILVVGPSWVGDMVMAQSLFKTLKTHRPASEIDVLAPTWSLPVIARMPEVRRGIAADVAHGEFGFVKRKRLGRQLRSQQYDRAIVLPRSFKSALVPWFARARIRTGFRGEMRFGLLNDIRVLDKSRLDQTVKRFIALGRGVNEPPEPVPQPSLTVSRENQQAALDRLKLITAKPVVALMPGAEYGPAKCWPLTHFADLANKLDAAGFGVWVMGSNNDIEAGDKISSLSSARNLCGQTSLEDAVDLLAVCAHAVSNDSGLMHIAAAVGTNIHAIYGSSTPDFTPPLTDRCHIHYRRLECSPCFRRHCPLEHLNCLKGIAPEAVFAGIRA